MKLHKRLIKLQNAFGKAEGRQLWILEKKKMLEEGNVN